MKKQSPIRLYVDFQLVDGEGRYILDRQGTIDDLNKYKIFLSEGLRLTFWSDDADEQGAPDPLVAEGIVEFNSTLGKWVARIDRNAIKHESELS